MQQPATGTGSDTMVPRLTKSAKLHNTTEDGPFATAFPRQVRLLTGNDFQQVFKQTGCRSLDSNLTILARRNNLQYARLGLAISKRTIKTAVGRNRVKRLVRESFRHHQAMLAGLDIVVMSRNGAPHASNPELTSALLTHWRRVAKQCAKS